MQQECWVGPGLRFGLRRPKVQVCRGPKKLGRFFLLYVVKLL